MRLSRNIGSALLLIIFSPVAQPHHGIDETLTAAGGTLLIDWRGEFTESQQDKMRTWIVSVGDTVRLLHGELPRPYIRFALQPYPSRSAVPFAIVLRNEPQGVRFYVNPERPLDEFVQDWTAYHELSHLFIPYPGTADVWFSEGLASYYQNILQFRAGLLSKDEALEKLRAGFERGHNDTRNEDLTLGELSANMRERMAFMRVYWSGAMYFLEADIRLHELGHEATPTPSVDAVLREFGRCCLLDERDWSGPEIAAEFDRIAATPLFLPLYREYEQTLAIPDYRPLLASPEMDAILGPGLRTGPEAVQ